MTTNQEYLDNTDLVVELIKNFPQTYSTILHKSSLWNRTELIILKRKMNRHFIEGDVCKMVIPGTRGLVLFYTLVKKYYILVDSSNRLTGSQTFVFFNYEQMGNLRLKVQEYWVLDDTEWKHFLEEKVFFEGNILKFF